MKTSTRADLSQLTHSQRPIWIGQQLDPGSPLYNMAFSFVFDGTIDVESFRRAWQRIVDRSESLRTTFVEQQGIVTRGLLPAGSCDLEVVDFTDRVDPRASFLEIAQRRASRVLVLEQQLVDAMLVRLGPEQFAFYLNQHHLVTDAASTVLLFRHLADEYAALISGAEHESLVPDSHYATMKSLAALPTTEMRRAAEAHWQRRQEDVDRSTPFYGRTGKPDSTASRRLSLELDRVTCDRLREIATGTDFQALTPEISVFNVFASLLLGWLHRVSGKRELGFDAPVYNRPTLAARNSIGLFIEMFPFAVDLEEGETFRTLAQKSLEETQRFLGHAHPATSATSVAAASNVVLNFFSGSFGEFAGIPTHVEWLHSGHGDRVHALRLQVHDFEGRGGYTLQFDANETIFDGPLHRRSLRHFDSLLQAFLDDPDRVISRVDILTDEERQLILIDYNQTSGQALPRHSVTELVRRQAQRTPERVALRQGSRQLTFDELDRQVESGAAELIERGISPGDRVAILARRSIETVVGILAILRARAAYVPLDPGYPSSRVDQILADSGARAMLVTAEREPAATATLDVLRLQIDPAVDRAEVPPQLLSPALHELAYTIYTSGSTGRPKGVPVDHGGLVDYLEWASRQYVRGDQLAFPLFTSLAFDLTITSLFLPLITGGTLHIYEEPTGPIDTALMDVLGDNAVDFIKLTPSHLALLRQMDLRDSRIQRMVVGGEDFRTSLARSIHDQFRKPIEIYNEYGPTEAVVGCMIHRYDPTRDVAARVPIGSPADHVQVYVLNETLTPVAGGVPGELCISRFGLSSGYRNLPELTADRFAPHPFHPNDILYRTGDLARFARPGVLEYLGRVDRQVKVSGIRVELAEIEAVLGSHPAITNCTVVALSRQPGRSLDSSELYYCLRCGLPSNYPGVHFDAEGVCSVCHDYDAIRDEAEAYFSDFKTLERIFAAARLRHRARYDCMLLLSGGKDSTYALGRLVDMGLEVYAFSLDNGYISEQAKDNIRRVCEGLAVDYELATTPAMNAIFRDSLLRFSNVCNGCYKAIYTLSLNRARDLGIPIVVTGLSRGQFFETRLTEGLFRGRGCTPQEVDQAVLEARKVYHRLDDEVARRLDVGIFQDDRIFEEIQILDFYRYCDVGLDEMLDYLEHRIHWRRPSDTGRSTNCLVNDVGIYIHQKERGFHNYALPYSWDVRMGHKTREAAIRELQDEIDRQEVNRMLAEIGYDENRLIDEEGSPGLVAYYVASRDVTAAELRRTLASTLPGPVIPQHLVRIDSMPTTLQGKIDLAALPSPTAFDAFSDEAIEPLVGPVQEQIGAIWRHVLGVGRVGATSNFFDLGGNSLAAMEVTLQLRNQFAVELPLPSLFQHPTVESLASLIETTIIDEVEQLSEQEAEQLARGYGEDP